MFKKSSNAQAHLGRSASFSTRASATGRNLLGWDTAPEEMTDKERYDALKLHLDRLIVTNDALKKDPRVSPEVIKQNKMRMSLAMEEMRILKGRFKVDREFVDNFSDYIIEAIKERVNPTEWAALVSEAQNKMQAVRQEAAVVLAATSTPSTQRSILRIKSSNSV